MKATPSKGRAKKADTAMEEFKSPKIEPDMNDTCNKMEKTEEIGSDDEIGSGF